MDSPTITVDKLKGMLVGHHLGDALGAPHEFYRWNRDRIYTGKLYLTLYRKNTMYGKNIEHIHPIGMVTDDTQMTHALIRSIIDEGKYDKHSVVLSYIAWAHSGNTGMGKNTQDLFKNKTFKGYESRYNRLLQDIKEEKRTEPLSNGCLMRCAPLAIFKSSKYVIRDCKITNPFDLCVEADTIYYLVLRHLLLGGSLEEVRTIISDFIKNDNPEKELKICLKEVLKGKKRDISGKDKGYILHALWCAFTALLMDKSYEDTMYWVITQRFPEDDVELPGVGDSDTNAAIAGALIGARDGWDKLSSSRLTKDNWKKVVKTCKDVDTDFRKFLPRNIDKTVEELLKLAN